MALIEREDALTILGNDRLVGIYRVVSNAWGVYQSYPIELRIDHSVRSRASLLHDHMISGAAKYAGQAAGIQIVERKKLYLFVVDAKLAIRFKKFDEELRTSNNPTGQVHKFKNQVQLPGIEAAHNLESGYILSEDGQSIQAIHLVCPSGRGIYWDVLLTESTQTTVVEDLFSKKIATEESDEGARVKRREEAKIIRLVKNDHTKS